MIEACIDLRQPLNPYDEAEALCLANDVADGPCPANSYPVMMVPDLNEDDEKDTAFKVCGLCPAGTAGDGFGCTSCQAGEYSTIGNDCAKCPIGTYSNAGEKHPGGRRAGVEWQQLPGRPQTPPCKPAAPPACAACRTLGRCRQANMPAGPHPLPGCAGSSVCIPCPTGTYADTEGTQECLQW